MRQQQAQYNQAGGLAGQQQPMIQYQYMPPNYNAQGFNTQVKHYVTADVLFCAVQRLA